MMKQNAISDHTPVAVCLISLKLFLTSFGDPIAHLGYFLQGGSLKNLIRYAIRYIPSIFFYILQTD
ncbi:hypothetical protein ACSFCW_19195 [Yokenella regensburgei]|uniref:hypothetical protein n=1 Tax=Yokenella regensburgei TaxID=158877 RepID=UPI003EDAE682